jgi:hypothetical protein
MPCERRAASSLIKSHRLFKDLVGAAEAEFACDPSGQTLCEREPGRGSAAELKAFLVALMAEGVTADTEGNVYGADFLGDVRKFGSHRLSAPVGSLDSRSRSASMPT